MTTHYSMDNQGFITFLTPHEIEIYRLMSIRGQLIAESFGFKNRKGAVRPRIYKEFGLGPRASHKEFIRTLTDLIHALKADGS